MPTLAISMLLAAAPWAARAQQSSQVGLAATGAVSLFEGFSIAQTSDPGYEFGAGIDLGWIGSPSNRLVLDATMLNALVRYRDSTHTLQRGPFYDFTMALGLARLLPRIDRVQPYVLAGVGVDALGSNTRNFNVDVLYNANRFSLYAAAGTLVTLSPDGQDGFQIEMRGSAVHNLSRASFRLGYVRFIGTRKWVPR